MTKIEVSFVLAIYNAERTLKECLDSILMQSFSKEKYEIIIVDGGSTDSTLKIVKEYMSRNKNIRFKHNPYKFSEGPKMGKDLGIGMAKGKFVALLDHDNILLEKRWLGTMLVPFRDAQIMASQSLLSAKKADTLFLEYVNLIGVEDPYAIPHSLVAQISLYPSHYALTKENYYTCTLDQKHTLFLGANGCIFRKEVFEVIGGYTRDVDISALMARYHMKVALPKSVHLYHKTASDVISFLVKKGKYYHRFISKQYKTKHYKWVQPSKRGKIKFALQTAYNLSFIGPLFYSLVKMIETRSLSWILHAPLLFIITAEYAIISLFYIKNLFSYLR